MDDLLFVLNKLTSNNGVYLRTDDGEYCTDCGSGTKENHTYTRIVRRAARGLTYLEERY